MRVAQVSPLFESVPPRAYGGTERIVSYLTEELVREGHEVSLFASADSSTRARLVAGAPRALRLDRSCVDARPHHLAMLERVLRQAERFDLVHFHHDYLAYPVARRFPIPILFTLHGRLDLRDLAPVFREFGEIPLVSISDSQRTPFPDANWQTTIHHGLPPHLYAFDERPERYLAFLGRISPEKRVDRAIEIAGRAGLPLRIAAKVDAADREYFEAAIRPLLRREGVEFLGEVGEAVKGELLGRAAALLFPIDWPEPFGLVMIEALACGTPVIAWRNGSVEEVIEDGVTGWVVDDLEGAVAAVGRIGSLSRRRCRRAFERRFTARRMARDYVAAYARLIEGRVEPATASEWRPA